jgi:adenylate kinase
VGLNVIMMGPPGAGKGTQAGRFARERGLLKISTGDILRDGARMGLPVALRAKERMDRGELVDDATMIAIVRERLVALRAKERMDRGELVDDATMIAIVRERLLQPDAQPGFVLDGFPRTVGQAEALDRIIAERANGPLVVVDVRVPEQELVRRLAGRLICASCGTNAEPPRDGSAVPTTCAACGGELVQRVDDNEHVVRERLKVYEQRTKPLVEFYRDRPTFRIVNGAQPLDRVAHELDTVIDDAAFVGDRQPADSEVREGVAKPAVVKVAPGKAARA